MQNCSELIKQIIDDNIMDCNGMIARIFNDLINIAEEKLVFLSKLIGEICIKKKVLFDLKDQFKTLSDNDQLNSSKKRFIGKILSAIGKKFAHCLHDHP